ncbi:MAG: D-alanyl-D-alanine carboxypeptidase/D-alanyl-D-alanine-endopeptidase [Phycisphaerae bacterium]
MSRPDRAHRRDGLPLVAAVLAVVGVAPLRAEPQATAPATVTARLDALTARVRNGGRIGLVVEEVASGGRWFALNPDLPLKPASVLKLFVTAAALEHLGADFAFETRLYLRDGELLVKGSGDPGLGDARLAARLGRRLHWEFDAWSGALRDRGVGEVRTIALDDSVFDQEYRHPDWPADQFQAWYQAPVGGLNFNDNCLDARVSVGGGKVQLALIPDLPPSFLIQELRVGSRHDPVVKRAADSDVFEFRGTVARGGEFAPLSVGKPTVFFGHALRRALEQHGIRVTGEVVRRPLPEETLAAAQSIYTNRTSLADVLWRCNTFSQNLFAECLMKALAAYDAGGRPSGVPGSWSGGAAVIERTLQTLGVSTDGAVFRDGSGLSHRNQVTAAQIAALLRVMPGRPHGETFIDSLADAGEEGTLRRQFSSPRFRDRLIAKTGTIRGVRALAGYVNRPDGVRLAFALLLNGDAPDDLPREVCDVLCSAGVSPVDVGRENASTSP